MQLITCKISFSGLWNKAFRGDICFHVVQAELCDKDLEFRGVEIAQNLQACVSLLLVKLYFNGDSSDGFTILFNSLGMLISCYWICTT